MWLSLDRPLMWWVPWRWKNLGELNFHYENGSSRTKMHLNPCQNMPRVQEHLTELSFLHFSGRGNWFSRGHASFLPKFEYLYTGNALSPGVCH